MKKVVSALALVLLASAACGGDSSVVINAPAAGTYAHMSIDEATAFLDKAAKEGNLAPTREVKSMADVLSVIETDEFENFPAARAFAEKDPAGKPLLALLEIEWAEQQLLIAGIVQITLRDIDDLIRDLRAAIGAGDQTQEKKLAELESYQWEAHRAQDALFTMAPMHARAGAAIAKELAATNPSSWEALALLAMHARVTKDWDGFAKHFEALKKVAADKPVVGFLEATYAAEHGGDFAKARELMEKFIAARPQWARARMHLVLWAADPNARYTEYQKLKQQSPRHAMVIFADKLFERAKSARDESDQRRRARATMYF